MLKFAFLPMALGLLLTACGESEGESSQLASGSCLSVVSQLNFLATVENQTPYSAVITYSGRSYPLNPGESWDLRYANFPKPCYNPVAPTIDYEVAGVRKTGRLDRAEDGNPVYSLELSNGADPASAVLAYKYQGSKGLNDIGRAADWQDRGGAFPGNAPGYSGNVLGFDLFVCSAMVKPGTWQAGHLARGQDRCYVAWGSSVVGYPQYRVLTGSGSYQWVHKNQALAYRNFINVGAQGVEPTGICRRTGNDRVAPYHNGKLIGTPGQGTCYASWGNANAAFGDYEVLVRMD
jgi:hypothetical protein